jgi:F-type H+-transporting ATPase subunit alpha
VAVDIVAAQQHGDVACVYVVIGQPMSRVLTLRRRLEEAGCLKNTTVIAADAASSPGMQYLAPYAGTSVAEWYREHGQHAIVVFDDLTKHADAYRELALLLGRPPGREAFPGDIFYVHAELLERAAARRDDLGGGSVTAFPIIETTDGDISSYIPTNLISITDGQIYLDTGRFERNQRPAIDIGRSVSRIGGVAQSPMMRAAAKNLKIVISRFEALESLTRVGMEMDVAMQETIRRGKLIRELLIQRSLECRDLFEQLVALKAVDAGWLEDIPLKRVREFVLELVMVARREMVTVAPTIAKGGEPSSDWQSQLSTLATTIRTRFVDCQNEAKP